MLNNILIITFVFVIIYLTISDLKTMTVGIYPFIIYACITLTLFLINFGEKSVKSNIINLLLSLLIGIFVLLISMISREGLGRADAFIFILNAPILKWKENLLVFICGIFLSAICGMFVLLFNRIKKSNRKIINIPFIPFIAPMLLFLVYKNYYGGIK